MSMIVEFRALWFYRLYQRVLRETGHRLSLKRVLGEEQNHLHDVATRLDAAGEPTETRAQRFLAAEQRLYERLLAAMRAEILDLAPSPSSAVRRRIGVSA